MPGPLLGAHVLLNRADASSWKAAAKAVAEKLCGSDAQDLDKSSALLKEQNRTHLKEEGAYGAAEPETPAGADHRAFSRLRAETEIYVVIKDICEHKSAPAPAEQLPPLVPIKKEEPKKVEQAPPPLEPIVNMAEPKPEPKPEVKPEEKPAVKKPGVKKQEKQKEAETPKGREIK